MDWIGLDWIGYLVIMDHGMVIRKCLRVNRRDGEEWEDLD
jgi:hypothetical protein